MKKIIAALFTGLFLFSSVAVIQAQTSQSKPKPKPKQAMPVNAHPGTSSQVKPAGAIPQKSLEIRQEPLQQKD
ncbi:MAG TPA: hypothetical protein PKK99_03975, partial [Bacteroidia bacterium]|nr:hypothetical protein [Bacteroidia bacterium]